MITTEELRDVYGYDHPPRAARDARDEGIPLETLRVRNSQGRTIAAYRFGDPALVRAGRTGERRSFPGHIATVDVRRLDILWSGEETTPYESLQGSAHQFNQAVQDYVKAIIARYLDRTGEG